MQVLNRVIDSAFVPGPKLPMNPYAGLGGQRMHLLIAPSSSHESFGPFSSSILSSASVSAQATMRGRSPATTGLRSTVPLLGDLLGMPSSTYNQALCGPGVNQRPQNLERS